MLEAILARHIPPEDVSVRILPDALIAAAIGTVCGLVCTWGVSWLVPTTSDQLRWALIAVGFASFFGSFFAFVAGAASAAGRLNVSGRTSRQH